MSQEHMSPYPCTLVELCSIATTPDRKLILEGFLRFRKVLLDKGLVGFQWLDGSFLEDIELIEGRSPKDIDVVTFSPSDVSSILVSHDPDLINRKFVKSKYSVDHLIVPLSSDPRGLVYLARYWFGLFSHQRNTGVWKGMLSVELHPTADDALACQQLGIVL